MNRVFVDMDGVLVDFDRYITDTGLTPAEIKAKPGSYFEMHPMPEAPAAIHQLTELGYEVWIATKPPTGVAHTYSDKAAWVFKHLPELKRRLIITPDKGLLGDAGDFLIDDRPHKANCDQFPGRLIHFTQTNGWPEILDVLTELKELVAS
jgi:5'(3')-deoxyribonucleotidase